MVQMMWSPERARPSRRGSLVWSRGASTRMARQAGLLEVRQPGDRLRGDGREEVTRLRDAPSWPWPDQSSPRHAVGRMRPCFTRARSTSREVARRQPSTSPGGAGQGHRTLQRPRYPRMLTNGRQRATLAEFEAGGVRLPCSLHLVLQIKRLVPALEGGSRP